MADPTRTEFLTRFPEFGEQSTDVVDGALVGLVDVHSRASFRLSRLVAGHLVLPRDPL